MIIKIKRYNPNMKESCIEEFLYEGDFHIAVSTFLKKLNSQEEIITVDGKKTTKIEWDCGCFEKKCGICSMVINKKPMLACDAFLDDVEKNGVVLIEPLSKFPLLKDLRVNRKIMFDGLLKLSSWVEASENIKPQPLNKESGLCLMCGCCIEACPNYIKNDADFVGPISFTNLLNEINTANDKERIKELKMLYNKHFKKHCTGALACSKACPIGLPIESLLSKLNRKL